MSRLIDAYFYFLKCLIALFLLGMVILVFGNVALRYLFNSGIIVSEELSRWLFVWLIFLGSCVAMREHGHLGVDMLVKRLPPTAKRACVAFTQLAMLYITYLITIGSWKEVLINWDVVAPASGLSLGYFYSSGVVFGVTTGLVLATDLYWTLSGAIPDDRLGLVRESEEIETLHSVPAEGNDQHPGTPQRAGS